MPSRVQYSSAGFRCISEIHSVAHPTNVASVVGGCAGALETIRGDGGGDRDPSSVSASAQVRNRRHARESAGVTAQTPTALNYADGKQATD